MDNETLYSIIGGNPVDGFKLHHIFTSEIAAKEWAESEGFGDDWHIVEINRPSTSENP